MNIKLRKALKRISLDRARVDDLVRQERYIVRQEQRELLGPKFPAIRVRKEKERIDPTWPKSKNQSGQSRPLLFTNPIKFIAREKGRALKDEVTSFLSGKPKWIVDQVAALNLDFSSVNDLINQAAGKIRWAKWPHAVA